MADSPQKAARPLSPFLTIFHWPVTMATSIAHRMTGIGLAGGAVVLAWWLFAVSNGPEAYGIFYRLAISPMGQILIYGFVWAFCYHFANGIRHLAWDFGRGFSRRTSDIGGIAVAAISVVLAGTVFALVHFGVGGYYGE
jgi:succinate dehydrogenase / fumarate reductase, cytochrome b subunit